MGKSSRVWEWTQKHYNNRRPPISDKRQAR